MPETCEYLRANSSPALVTKEPAPELLLGPEYERLDRRHGRVHHLSDFLVGMAFIVRQHEGNPLAVRQIGHGLLHRRSPGFPFVVHRSLQGLRRPFRIQPVERDRRLLPLSSELQALVDDNPVKPGGEPRFPFESAGLGPDDDEDFLGDVVGCAAVADIAVDGVQD